MIAPEHRNDNTISTHHHHHHHHHRHHSRSYERYERREQCVLFLRRVFYGVLVVLLAFAVVIAGMAVFAPEALHHKEMLGGDAKVPVEQTRTDNQHLRLDYDGIDVSHHQGKIDWMLVARDTCVKFVYIKATEGSDFIDPSYKVNLRQARAAGLRVGSYHYLTSKSTIEEQFRNFCDIVDRNQQDLVPMIDIEEEGIRDWSHSEIVQNLSLMIHLMSEHFRCMPLIYSYAKFYNENLAPYFNSYQLFLAHYNEKEPVVAGAGSHNIWQHSDQGIVDGILVPVDLDVFASGTTINDILRVKH